MRGQPLPSGDVTFLLTDIEGSTSLFDRVGHDRYVDLLTTHDALIREASGRHGGVEVGTEGDAFLIAFPEPGPALRAAVEAQQALTSHRWPADAVVRVRMGLHRGEAVPEPDRDYVSLALHQASRVAHAPHGGQVVCTTDVLEGADGLWSAPLGSYWLRDFAGPVPLHEVGPPGGGRSGFPALRAPRADLTNLPASRGSLVGREVDLARLTRVLAAPGLVTLAGPGGIGKTRLALASAAAGAAQGRPTWLVELATLEHSASAEAVTALACRALGSTSSTLAGLADRAGAPGTLVVLDNAEHVLDGTAAVVEHLQREVPGVAVLVTSREPLALDSELVLRLDPLGVADEGADPHAVRSSPATRLFVERARAARHDFVLTDDNADAVAALCRALDGVPLALELAAARSASLGPDELLRRGAEVGDVPGAVRRGSGRRHSTLRTVLDWSLGLCTPTELAVLRRLGAFAGAAPLDAVTAVCGGDGLTASAVVEALGGLVDKSLVVRRSDSERYDLLVVVRTVAAEHLAAADERDEALLRHALWVAAAVREACPLGVEPGLPTLLPLLPEATAVLERGSGGQLPVETYAEVLVGLRSHLSARDPVLGARHAEALLTRGGLAPRVAVEVHDVLCTALIHLDDPRRRDAAERFLEAARAVDDPCLLAVALVKSARPNSEANDVEDPVADARLDEAATLLPVLAADPRRWDVVVSTALGARDRVRGHPESARERYLQSLDAARETANAGHEGISLYNLAELDAEAGDLERAADGYAHAAAAMAVDGRHLHRVFALLDLSDVLTRLGRPTAADDAAADAVVSARRASRPAMLQRALLTAARSALALGHPERALSCATEAVTTSGPATDEARQVVRDVHHSRYRSA